MDAEPHGRSLRTLSGAGPPARGPPCSRSASSSTPRTSRGPGREKYASASTAQTCGGAGSSGLRHDLARGLDRAVEVEAAGHHDDDVGRRRGDVGPVEDARAGAASASSGSPPARAIMSGIQCPGLNGGSVHSSARRVGGAARRPRARTAVEPLAQTGHDHRGLVGGAGRRPTSPTAAMTSSRLAGSSESTSARQPRTSSASWTAPAGTAQTWQRSWVMIRSGWMARIRSTSRV